MEGNLNSEFSNAIKQIQEQTKAMSDRLQSIIRPALEGMNRYKEIIAPIVERNRQFSLYIEQLIPKFEIPDVVKVISKLKDVQYVYWDYLPRSFVDKVLSSIDTDAIILECESENDYADSECIISECANHEYLTAHRTLFEQCISNYHSESYSISAIGLSAVIDAVLTEATNNPTHRSLERCRSILDKLKEKEAVDEGEYALLTLYMTFNATVESFYKTVPFSEDEPSFLNRNWLVHGRSTREFSRLDCIKLIRLLRGIMILSGIEAAEADDLNTED